MTEDLIESIDIVCLLMINAIYLYCRANKYIVSENNAVNQVKIMSTTEWTRQESN